MSEPAPEFLDGMQRDALTELINIGINRAAANLATMINHEVLLSVPSISVMPRTQAARTIAEPSTIRFIVLRHTFEGDLRGRAMLIFPEANSL